MTTKRDWCVRCREHKWLKARGLCESCYMHVKGTGHLYEYPTRAERRQQAEARGIDRCRCFEPIRENLAIWNAVQCRRCGRQVIE